MIPQMLFYIKVAWLSGAYEQECATWLIQHVVKQRGIVSESLITNLVHDCYCVLNQMLKEIKHV